MSGKAHLTKPIVTPLPVGEDARRARAGLKSDLELIIEAIDRGVSLKGAVEKVIRALAVAMLP